ncbi:MAG: hypothetical protein ABI268_05060 [Rhodanobacter sp.]
MAAQATHEMMQIIAEDDAILAWRWTGVIEDALRHIDIGSTPKTGSTRFAMELKLDRLCVRPAKGFPYLVFHIEHENPIDVGRMLQTKRDIPTSTMDAE